MKTDPHSSDSKVILVHGTFASSENDRGSDWWQVGSDFYRSLQAKLWPNVELAGEGEVFHWSGENHERARGKAAAELLKFLRRHEEAGNKYHLVGHSHGGSVIWNALRMATVRGEELKCLTSWSTVGTPFLHHRSRSPFSPINLLYLVLGSLLLYPVARTFWFLAMLVFGTMNQGIVIAGHDRVGPVLAIVRAPFLKLVEVMGVPLQDVADGIRVGSYDPASGASLNSYLLGTFEGWVILFGIIASAYCTLLLCSCCIGPVCEVFRNTWEKKLEQRAFQRYGDRWLGLWTRDDEAINGLRKTLELSVSFVGTLVPRERVYISDLVSMPSRPLLSVVAPFYNRLVRPVLDSTIRNMVIKTAQGNNRPAADVIAVSPHPALLPSKNSAPSLPRAVSLQLLSAANMHAEKLGPKLREFFAEPSFSAGLEKLSHTLDSKTLVHTSYFDHDEVVELLAMNITSSEGLAHVRRLQANPELIDWFDAFRSNQHATIVSGSSTPASIRQPSSDSRKLKQAA